MRFLRIFVLFVVSVPLYSQVMTMDAWRSYAYEDMSDWMRRLPGMFPMDYGVAGAPVVFRPWGFNPWYIGVERDGIPWHRFSDGLYESNLDSPEELESVAFAVDGLDPLGTLKLTGRSMPADSPRTELLVREGYYGFGRVDFAHAQSFSPRFSAEGRGRLFWYNGLREGISKSKSYKLRGELNYRLNSNWNATIEYGGSNAEAQSPQVLRPAPNQVVRPNIYCEREHGTVRMRGIRDGSSIEFGAHLRQDREERDKYFGLREQYFYGFVDASKVMGCSDVGLRLAFERANFSFPGESALVEEDVSLQGRGSIQSAVGSLKARILYRRKFNDRASDKHDNNQDDLSAATEILTPRFLNFAIYGLGLSGRKSVPIYWQIAQFRIEERGLLVDDSFAKSGFFGGVLPQSEANRGYETALDFAEAGLDWTSKRGRLRLGWRFATSNGYGFVQRSDTLYLDSQSQSNRFEGPAGSSEIRITKHVRFQSLGEIVVDADEKSRALDTRSFSRLVFSRTFFKSQLHIESYAAYEHIGRRRATSDLRSEVIGPAHLVHFRIEGTIEGVTLIWGVENLTGQHYEYLPGYMMIRKEEYFGLRWTLAL